jgi:hypothetical protein
MATPIRAVYADTHPQVAQALEPLHLQHRDFIYREHLELPVRF